MKKLLSILLLAASSALGATDTNLWFATITITNNPVITNGLLFTQPTVTTLLFSNNTTAATVLTNNTLAGATTNLFLHFAAYAVGSPRLAPKLLGSNVIQLSGSVDQPIAFTATGNWCSLVITSRPLTKMTAVRTPISGEGTNAVGIASSLITDLGTLPTNSIPTNATALLKYADLTSVQTLQKKVITNSTLTGIVMSNATFRATNSFCEDCIWLDAILTNGVNYGNAFSSPGTGASSEQFGAAAGATGGAALAVGNSASASGDNATAINAVASAESATAIGILSTATGTNSTAVGTVTEADGNDSTAIGYNSLAGEVGSTALGANTLAQHTNSTAVGYGAATTANNQVMLGAAAVDVMVNNKLQAGSITNSTMTGSNRWQGDISFNVNRNGSLANGNNADVLLTNKWVKFGGPSGAFTNAGFNHLNSRDGLTVKITNTNGFPMALLNQSGLEATPERRIITGTGGTLVITNNPGNVVLYYDPDALRWCIESNTN